MPAGTVCALGSHYQACCPPPHFTFNKYWTSQGLYNRFKSCPDFLCPHAALVFHAASRAFCVASQTTATNAVARDATFLFDKRPSAWYLKGRDVCRHVWKTSSKQGVSPYAKTHPQLVPPRSTFTDGDARVCRARQKRAADIMSPKSRNLLPETDPAV